MHMCKKYQFWGVGRRVTIFLQTWDSFQFTQAKNQSTPRLNIKFVRPAKNWDEKAQRNLRTFKYANLHTPQWVGEAAGEIFFSRLERKGTWKVGRVAASKIATIIAKYCRIPEDANSSWGLTWICQLFSHSTDTDTHTHTSAHPHTNTQVKFSLTH